VQEGKTPLHNAVKAGDQQAVVHLLSEGAPFDVADKVNIQREHLV